MMKTLGPGLEAWRHHVDTQKRSRHMSLSVFLFQRKSSENSYLRIRTAIARKQFIYYGRLDLQYIISFVYCLETCERSFRFLTMPTRIMPRRVRDLECWREGRPYRQESNWTIECACNWRKIRIYDMR